MTDRAEPGVTPTLRAAVARLPHNGSCAWQSGNDDCDCHKADALAAIDAIDAATPRPGLVEAAQKLISDWDGLKHGLWTALKDDVAALRAALASGTGEPGLDVERLARSLRALEARGELTVADGFLGGRDDGDYVTFATSIAAAYANDKGADPTPEPRLCGLPDCSAAKPHPVHEWPYR
jgi:hypothetical protein